jgi:hypothetical protein
MGDMSSSSIYTVDRSGWEDGPWNDEPDRVEWTTRVGLPGLALRQATHGAWCGYAAIGAHHPLFHVGYDACTSPLCDERYSCQHRPDSVLRAHGGLTFSGTLNTEISTSGDNELWWLGFDCCHYTDYQPGWSALMRAVNAACGVERIPSFHGRYRTLAYVREEVEDLAAQLLDLY